MGTAMLAAIQGMYYLVPTRFLNKSLHEKRSLATGTVCHVTNRQHQTTGLATSQTNSPKTETTLALVVTQFW